jgi:hypothetical protein
MILASLKEAAAIKGCSVEDLIPSDELEQYARVRLGKGRLARNARQLIKTEFV